PKVRSGFPTGSIPLRIASRAFSRRIDSSGIEPTLSHLQIERQSPAISGRSTSRRRSTLTRLVTDGDLSPWWMAPAIGAGHAVQNDWMHLNVTWRSSWLEWLLVT